MLTLRKLGMSTAHESRATNDHMVAAADYGGRIDATDPPGVAPSRPSSTPPRRIAVVVNGRARNVTAEVVSTLDQILKGGDLFVSRSMGDAREIAKTLVARGY